MLWELSYLLMCAFRNLMWSTLFLTAYLLWKCSEVQSSCVHPQRNMDIALQTWGFVLFKTCPACLKPLVIINFVVFNALKNLRVKRRNHMSLSRKIKELTKATTQSMQNRAEENRNIFFRWKRYLSYPQMLSNCCHLENLTAMQTERDKAQAGGKGKTRHLRLSQSRLDKDLSAGTLDAPEEILRDCPEVDMSESRGNNSLWAQHCPSEINPWGSRGGRKGESETTTIPSLGPASQVSNTGLGRCCSWMAVITHIQSSAVRCLLPIGCATIYKILSATRKYRCNTWNKLSKVLTDEETNVQIFWL